MLCFCKNVNENFGIIDGTSYNLLSACIRCLIRFLICRKSYKSGGDEGGRCLCMTKWIIEKAGCRCAGGPVINYFPGQWGPHLNLRAFTMGVDKGKCAQTTFNGNIILWDMSRGLSPTIVRCICAVRRPLFSWYRDHVPLSTPPTPIAV